MYDQKKIIAVISFLLLTFPFVTLAGCGGEVIISSNNIDLDCIKVTTNPCGATISVENKCKKSFFYHTNGRVETYSSSTSLESFPMAKLLVNNNLIEIPTNWKLNIFMGRPESLCSPECLRSGKPCFSISYKKNFFSNNSVLEFGTDRTDKGYKIKWYYEKNEEIEYEKNFQLVKRKIEYVILFLFIFICICFFVNKYKNKSKKK